MEHEIWGHPRVAVHICDNEGGGTEMVFSGRGVVASRAWTAGWAHSAVVKSTHAPHVSRDHRLRCLVFLGQWWKEYCFER